MQTLLHDFRPFFEIAGLGSLCGWAVSLALGLGFCKAERALACGVFGILFGKAWFDALGLPIDPSFDGLPLIASLAGTLFVISVEEFLKRLHEELTLERKGGTVFGHRPRFFAGSFTAKAVQLPRPRVWGSWKRRGARQSDGKDH